MRVQSRYDRLVDIAFLSDFLTSSGVMFSVVFKESADMFRSTSAGAPIAYFALEVDASSDPLEKSPIGLSSAGVQSPIAPGGGGRRLRALRLITCERVGGP